MIRLKLNKDRQIGASLQQKIYNFIKVTLSFNLDLHNLPRGDHKVGLAIEIEDSWLQNCAKTNKKSSCSETNK